MIKLTDNFNSFNYYQINYINFSGKSSNIEKDKKIIKDKLHITLKDYQNKNNIFFSFFNDEEKKSLKNSDEELVISIIQQEENYTAQTGNYIGKFIWNGLEIDIQSRFNTEFLERMLNFANDVFLNDVSIFGKETKENIDISKFIIYYLFIQKLEKAFLLGLPKSYKTINHHDIKLKGKIDINRFIKHDIPFKGKISSTSQEQKEIQEIIDVLYKAITIIEKNGFSTKNISHIKTHIKQHRSNKFVSNETINKALHSKALQNPIFAPYKKVLEYTKFIIDSNTIQETNNGKKETYGFLINIAELFEIYITKLLQKEFSDWSVSSPKLRLDKYFGNSYLYQRAIIPDIVMKHHTEKKVLVFDTKYKRMKFTEIKGNGSDIDRYDFFQINTYMNYYQNSGYQVVAGGLLYPMEEAFNKNICHSENWLGKEDTKFIVDGIDLSELNKKQIQDLEKKFIESIKGLIIS